MNPNVLKSMLKPVLALVVAAGLGLLGTKYLGPDFAQLVCQNVPAASEPQK